MKQRSKEANYWTVNIGLKSCDWRKDAFDFSRKWLFIVYNFAETCNLLQYRSPIRVTPHQEGKGSLVPVLRLLSWILVDKRKINLHVTFEF